jgi:hypothetical protein
MLYWGIALNSNRGKTLALGEFTHEAKAILAQNRAAIEIISPNVYDGVLDFDKTVAQFVLN